MRPSCWSSVPSWHCKTECKHPVARSVFTYWQYWFYEIIINACWQKKSTIKVLTSCSKVSLFVCTFCIHCVFPNLWQKFVIQEQDLKKRILQKSITSRDEVNSWFLLGSTARSGCSAIPAGQKSVSSQPSIQSSPCRLWQLPRVPLRQAWSENSEHNSVLRQEKRLEIKILFKVDTYARPTKLLRESFIQRVKAALLGSFRNILSCGNFSPGLPFFPPFFE